MYKFHSHSSNSATRQNEKRYHREIGYCVANLWNMCCGNSENDRSNTVYWSAFWYFPSTCQFWEPETHTHTHTLTLQFKAFTALLCLCKTAQRAISSSIFNKSLLCGRLWLEICSDTACWQLNLYVILTHEDFSSGNSLTKLVSALNRACWYSKTFTTF